MFFSFLNRKLKKYCLSSSCLLIHGDRGCGKSSVMALILEAALKSNRPVYCQYPYDGAYIIPCKKEIYKGVTRFDVDKDWLYSHEFEEGAVVMLDEGSTIWPARDFARWSKLDSDFFNFIRKQHITIVIASQYYDQLDLNIKRSADETWFLDASVNFLNMTYIESSLTKTVKVADKNTEVLGRAFKKGARKITFEVCEIPWKNYRFYRKPYYGKFQTDYVPFRKVPQPQPLWNEVVNF